MVSGMRCEAPSPNRTCRTYRTGSRLQQRRGFPAWSSTSALLYRPQAAVTVSVSMPDATTHDSPIDEAHIRPAFCIVSSSGSSPSAPSPPAAISVSTASPAASVPDRGSRRGPIRPTRYRSPGPDDRGGSTSASPSHGPSRSRSISPASSSRTW